jgi:hypothetical protein
MIESIALAFFPLINGAIIEAGNKDPDKQRGYVDSSIFFVLIGLLGILTSIGLLFIPDKYKRRLDKASKEELTVAKGENGELIFSAS